MTELNLRQIGQPTRAESVNPQEMPSAGALATELFLQENYQFRKNILNGKVEFIKRGETDADYRPLTKEALNSIVLRAKREEVSESGSPQSDIELYVNSEEVLPFNPVKQFLGALPKWDGKNHVAELFSRLPGITSEQSHFLSLWLHSAVAHWLQMDSLHGNECVPTLIGAQGCGKTTFFTRLLPMELREYFMDNINLSNRFDKEMALTNNLLVNLDELDAIRPSQHAALKQTLSKSKVNGRPIYGAAQQDRPRYASFTATTNNRHPLTDVTGSRRFICIEIPKGQYIDNTGEIDYQQLYAQLVYELQELKAVYWFSNDEVARIQELNLDYMAETDLDKILSICFRKPDDNETGRKMTSSDMLEVIRSEFSSVPRSHGMSIQIGQHLKSLGFVGHTVKGRTLYEVILCKAA